MLPATQLSWSSPRHLGSPPLLLGLECGGRLSFVVESTGLILHACIRLRAVQAKCLAAVVSQGKEGVSCEAGFRAGQPEPRVVLCEAGFLVTARAPTHIQRHVGKGMPPLPAALCRWDGLSVSRERVWRRELTAACYRQDG